MALWSKLVSGERLYSQKDDEQRHKNSVSECVGLGRRDFAVGGRWIASRRPDAEALV